MQAELKSQIPISEQTKKGKGEKSKFPLLAPLLTSFTMKKLRLLEDRLVFEVESTH